MLRITVFTRYLSFVLRTKGIVGFFVRIGMLVKRFDLSGKKVKRSILKIEQIGRKYQYKPALIIPAVILKRHHRILGYLSDSTSEFGIHGYVHQSFKPLSMNEQITEIRKAKDVFKKFRLPTYGFRAPYLSCNNHTAEAIQENDLLWESDETFIWNGFLNSRLPLSGKLMANAVQLLYAPLDSQENIVIPRLQGETVCIPVTLPDDEILIDRLGIKDSNNIEKIWSEMLDIASQRGDILVLQLHPERFPICKEVLENLLEKALFSFQNVWIAGMSEVAEWWKQKRQFKFVFQNVSHKGYNIRCECTDRATILGRNLFSKTSQAPFYQDYYIIEGREIFLESENLQPCIGVHPKCSEMLLKFLEDEGFPYEVSDNHSKYSLFLDNYETFSRKDEMALLRRIEESTNPLVRYWRWPDGMKSAFVTTHDLDCLTLTDFLYRAFGK